MCARYVQAALPERLERLLEVELPEGLQPRYNVAPTQSVLAVVAAKEGREAKFLRWGLVPSWAEDPSIGQRLINARAETAREKPSFRQAFRRRRCLIPATAFYEWKHLSEADERTDEVHRDQPSLLDDDPPKPKKTAVRKQPYLIRLRDERPFAFAGLWERWHDAQDRVLETCTILTTEPNELMSQLHNRMPCILEPRDFADWLDHENDERPERLMPLLTPLPAEEMEAFPVRPEVSNPRNEGPELVRPLT